MEERANHRSTWIYVATILTAGMLGVALILANAMLAAKRINHSIEVVGSARKQIHSDLATWSGVFSAQATRLPDAYGLIQQSRKKVQAYLSQRGLAEKDLVFSALTTSPVYVTLPNGQSTTRIESYRLSQEVSLRSTDLQKVDEISRNATELIQAGIEFQSNSPCYYYTKIADLKLEVLSLASQDARQRAGKIAENTGARAGRLTSALQGVFQITPLNSTEVSGMGVYDTTSIDKEVMGVVICNFEIGR